MKRYILFILLNICTLYGTLQASHAMGGYIQYTWLKNNRYGVEIQVFRDCRGIIMPANSGSPLKITFVHKNGSIIGTDTLQSLIRTSLKDVTFLCPSKKPPCDPVNTYNTGEGIEKHVFYVEVDFDSSRFSTNFKNSNLCEIVFSWEQCCRNGAITTGQANQTFYLQSTMNLCTSAGTKLNWVNTNALPFFEYPNRFCCNNKQTHFIGAFDTMDLDSVSFQLAPALTARNTSATYASPFSYRIPLTPYCVPSGVKCTPQPTLSVPRGFYYDSLTGIAIFTPTKCDEYAVLAIEVREFRKVNGKWELISKSQMEKQLLNSDYCPYNYYTKLTIKARDTGFVGKLHSQKMYSKDDTGAISKIIDTTTIKVLNMPNGATYTRNSPFRAYDSGVFKWTPGYKWSGINYKLYVAALDNKCDIPFYELKIQNLFIKSVQNQIRIRTYHDKNGNCKRDSNEAFVGKVRFVIEGGHAGLDQFVETNDTGFLKTTVAYGPRKIRFIPGEIYYTNCSGLQLPFVKFDSAMDYEIPVLRKTFIRGKFFNDHDSDCVQNKSLDVAVDKVLVKSDMGHSAWTLSDGSFHILCDTGSYTLTLPNFVSLGACGTASKLTSIKVLKDSFVDLGNLPVYNNITDLEVTMEASRLLRGGTTTVSLNIKNIGSRSLQTFTTGNYPKIYLDYPKKLTYNSCSGSCANDTGKALLTWTLSNIENGAGLTYTAKFTANPSNYFVGDNIVLSLYLDSAFSDYNHSNNAFGFKITVRGPYDPNKKISETSDSSVCSEPVVYRVDFQNTGNDTAFDVLVTDTLSTHFDLNTLRPINSSAPVQLSTEKSIASFLFRNHKLTDSVTSLVKSRGFIIFSIKLKDSTDKQLNIENRASIVFDYEKPVNTNTHQLKTIPYTEVIGTNKASYCGETDVTLSYKVNYIGTISRLQLQLSDTSGNFAIPQVLKNWTHYPNTEIQKLVFALPQDLPSSRRYRLRIVVLNPSNHSFIKHSDSFEIKSVNSNFSLNKQEYCDKDSIFITVSGAQYHSIIYNGSYQKFNVANGTYFVAIASLSKNDITVISESQGCTKTRNISFKANAQPTFIAILVYETICTDSMSKLSVIGPDKYSIYWNSSTLYDTVPKGLYAIPGNIKKDTIYLHALNKFGCKSVQKILGPIYETQTWTAKTTDTVVCRGSSSKLSLAGLVSYDVVLASAQIYKSVSSGNYNIKVPKSNEAILVTGYSNLGCPYSKNLVTPKINNETNFSASVSDKYVCTGGNALLQLHDRNDFDICKDGSLIFVGHDSSTINLTGDTLAKTLMIVGKTALGCRDTQWLNTPELDNWLPFLASVDRSLVCDGDSAILTISGRPKFSVFFNQQAVYSLVGPATYKLPADTVVRKYEIHAISPIGCIDTAIVSGAREEQFFPKLSGSLAIPPFCDGDSIEITYTGSPLCDLLNHNQAISTLMHNETKKISVPASKGVLLQSRFTSDLGCLYTSNVLSYKSNTIPPKPVISRQGDTLFSSAAYYNNWYYYGGQRTGLKDTASRFIPDSNAAYFVKVVEPSGCYNQSDTIQFQKKINSLYSPQNGSVISLNPNPFSESLRIRSADPIESVHVYTLDGRTVPLNLKRISSTDYEILLLDATSGVYVAEIVTNNSAVFRRKIIRIIE